VGAELCISASLLSVACGGGSSGGSGPESSPNTDPPVTEATWQQAQVLTTISSSGTSIRVVSKAEEDNLVHMAYYDNVDDDAQTAELFYAKIQLNEDDIDLIEQSTQLNVLDNSNTLEMAFDTSNTPVLTYRGGEELSLCSKKQSDIMMLMPGNGGWDEYMAAMGYNPRNPAEPLQDGMVGDVSAIAIDSQNRAHIIYTFLYEGCDSYNHAYPDLRYVRIDASNPDGTQVEEETVHGNDYPSFNVVGSDGHNSAGHYGEIVLDSEDRPLVFYAEKESEHNSVVQYNRGLRFATRDEGSGEWTLEWIEPDVDVAAISAAVAADGTVGVAFALILNNEDERYKRHVLKYAQLNVDGNWVVEIVDNTASVGTHCSLAFSADNEPLIAYYAIKSHTQYDLNDLRFAWRDNDTWEQEPVAQAGDVGWYNNLWVDSEGYPHIITHKRSPKEIRHYVKR
jgi:hypothetical protein